MTEMIEKCARAIYAKNPNGGYARQPNTAGGWDSVFVPDPWEDAPDRHEDCREIAAAVIDALMDPTPLVVADGLMAYELNGISPVMIGTAEDHVELIWQAMLSKAKSE